MSKITFRADEDLINEIEGLDASKSEVMRDALRAYLGLDLGRGLAIHSPPGDAPQLEDASSDWNRSDSFTGAIDGIDLTIRLTPTTESNRPSGTTRSELDDTERVVCSGCGELVDVDHAHCPNCGHPRARRVVCECGHDLQSDWSFCPICGRRTPSVDVLDRT